MTWDLGQLKSYLLAVFFWHLLHWYGLELLLMFVPDLDTYALPLTNWKRKWGVSMWVWNRTPQNPTIDHPYFPNKNSTVGLSVLDNPLKAPAFATTMPVDPGCWILRCTAQKVGVKLDCEGTGNWNGTVDVHLLVQMDEWMDAWMDE